MNCPNCQTPLETLTQAGSRYYDRGRGRDRDRRDDCKDDDGGGVLGNLFGGFGFDD